MKEQPWLAHLPFYRRKCGYTGVIRVVLQRWWAQHEDCWQWLRIQVLRGHRRVCLKVDARGPQMQQCMSRLTYTRIGWMYTFGLGKKSVGIWGQRGLWVSASYGGKR